MGLVDFGFSDGVSLTTAARAAVKTTLNGSVTLLASLDGATEQGTDGRLGVLTDGFHGSLTKNSNQFTSPDMTFTAALVGADLTIGGTSYRLKKFINAHTFELYDVAAATVTNAAFTLNAKFLANRFPCRTAFPVKPTGPSPLRGVKRSAYPTRSCLPTRANVAANVGRPSTCWAERIVSRSPEATRGRKTSGFRRTLRDRFARLLAGFSRLPVCHQL